MKNILKDKTAIRDIVLVILLVVLGGGMYIGNQIMNRKPAVIVEVSVDGVVVEELDLSKDTEFVVKGYQGGTNTLVIENGQVYRTNYDKNYKKGASSYFGKLLEFIDGIKEIEANPFISKQQEITNLFIQENLSSERYLLGLAQNDERNIVVTDEPFVCIMCELENIPHISTIDFLFNQNLKYN